MVQLQDTGKGNGLLASAVLLVDIGHTTVACECDNDLVFPTTIREEVVVKGEAPRAEATASLASAKVWPLASSVSPVSSSVSEMALTLTQRQPQESEPARVERER